LLKLAFQLDGYAVDTALSGEHALELAAVHEYDVMILDLTLPDLDGIDVCRRLRSDQPRLLIILLTARTAKAEIITGLDAGADDYLTKPFDYEELVARHHAGFNTLAAYDGRAALDLLQRINPDLIILDLGLPDMDGLDVCREIRQASMVPIVMLTKRSTEPDRQQGLAAGASAYITKPFDASDLQTTVRSLLNYSAP